MFLTAVSTAATVVMFTTMEMTNAATARMIAAMDRPLPAPFLPDWTSPMIPKIRPKKARKSPPMLTMGMKELRAPKRAKDEASDRQPVRSFDLNWGPNTLRGRSQLIAHRDDVLVLGPWTSRFATGGWRSHQRRSTGCEALGPLLAIPIPLQAIRLRIPTGGTAHDVPPK